MRSRSVLRPGSVQITTGSVVDPQFTFARSDCLRLGGEGTARHVVRRCLSSARARSQETGSSTSNASSRCSIRRRSSATEVAGSETSPSESGLLCVGPPTRACWPATDVLWADVMRGLLRAGRPSIAAGDSRRRDSPYAYPSSLDCGPRISSKWDQREFFGAGSVTRCAAAGPRTARAEDH